MAWLTVNRAHPFPLLPWAHGALGAPTTPRCFPFTLASPARRRASTGGMPECPVVSVARLGSSSAPRARVDKRVAEVGWAPLVAGGYSATVHGRAAAATSGGGVLQGAKGARKVQKRRFSSDWACQGLN